MTDREKLIETMKAAEMERCFVTPCGSCKYKDEGCCLLGLYADALVEAGFGNVKELRTELRSKVDYKHEQDDIIGHYKHRAEVAERALLTACVNIIKGEEDNVNMELLARVVYTKYLRKAEKELAEEKRTNDR